MPSYLGNFPNVQSFEKFRKSYNFQIPKLLGNFPDSQTFREFPKFFGFLEILNFDHFLNFWHSILGRGTTLLHILLNNKNDKFKI